MPVRVGLQYIEKWKSSMENAVRRYEEEPIIKGQIVFYGPSNFTRWSEKWKHRPLRTEVLGKSGAECCINRGFGSSNAEHQLYYYHRMVRPLEPKALVYFPFGNYRSFGYSTEETWELAQRVVMYTLTDFPEANVYLLGCRKPYNETEESIARVQHCNDLMKAFCEENDRCFYLNTFDYEPLGRKDILVEDKIHFNQTGYDIYAEFFREAIKNELDQF